MKLNRSGLQFKVLVIVATGMLAALFASLLALSQVYSTIKDLDRITREDFVTQQNILIAAADFKEQVQEWKNVLLRGRDPSDLARYWTSFEKDEKDVAERLRKSREGTPDATIRAKLAEALDAHKAAGDQYRKALEAYKDALDPYVGDKVARGVDRKLFAAMEEAADLARKA